MRENALSGKTQLSVWGLVVNEKGEVRNRNIQRKYLYKLSKIQLLLGGMKKIKPLVVVHGKLCEYFVVCWNYADFFLKNEILLTFLHIDNHVCTSGWKCLHTHIYLRFKSLI